MSGAQLWLDTLGILPELAVAIFALLVLIWDFAKPNLNKEWLAGLSLLGLGIALALTVPLWGQQQTLFANSLVIDHFAVCFKVICLVVSALVIIISTPYLKRVKIERGEYYSLLLFATLGIMIVAGAVNLLTIYLGLELLGISSYILTAFLVDDERSGEAAIKYFLMGSVASVVLVYGMTLIYGVTGQINIYAIKQALVGGQLHNPGLLAGLVLLLAGLGFKIGMVPFHMWLPDVYEGAPTPIAGFIATVAKLAPVAALLRILLIGIVALSSYWINILAILAAITITLGNLLALRQENIKRMLAFSGITHIGYVLIGVVAAGISRDIGFTSVVFYFIVYVLANVGAFGVIIYICQEDGRWGENYEDFKGLAKVSPLAAMVMSIFVLSLLGMPPTGGFMGKFWVFAAAMKTNLMWLAVVGIVNAIISSYYYLRVLVVMYMHEPSEELVCSSSPSLAAALLFMAVVTVYMGLNPGLFYDFAHKSLSLFL